MRAARFLTCRIRRPVIRIHSPILRCFVIKPTSSLSKASPERRFVADVGLTPREYRSRLRLARPRWLVEHADLRLTDIGFDCGFGNCSHFSRAFTKHFNIPRSSLRQESQ